MLALENEEELEKRSKSKTKPSPTATQPAGPFFSRPSPTPRSLSLPHRPSFSRVAWPALPRAATLAPALFPAPHGPHPRPSSRRPAPAAPALPHARRPLAALPGPHASVTPAQRRAPLTALAHPPAPSPPPLSAAQRPGAYAEISGTPPFNHPANPHRNPSTPRAAPNPSRHATQLRRAEQSAAPPRPRPSASPEPRPRSASTPP